MTKPALGHVIEDVFGDFMDLPARTEQDRMLPHGGHWNVLARPAVALGINA
jgi:hypothetical protein